MSQALFTREAGSRHEARSAGTSPGSRVQPVVVEAMREIGLDVSGNVPAKLTTELAQWADLVVTMGCGDECPVMPGKRYIDWELPDPKDMPIEKVREVRDDIERRVRDLLPSLESTRVKMA
jgi:arsenate reductase (thioredoxin)